MDILIFAGASSLYSSVHSRRTMKEGDLKIKEEAEREREAASEEGSLDFEVKHHKHPQHSLRKAGGDGDEEFSCGSCARLGRGTRYRCSKDGCSFQMHMLCASSPVILVGGDFGARELPEMVDTFAHRQHGLLRKKDYGEVMSIFECGHCNAIGKGLRYICEGQGCDYKLHPICAKCPTRINSHMHPEHELELTTRPYFAKCVVCNRGRKTDINNRMYTCKACKLYIHPTCSMWPLYLFHGLHPGLHPLQLQLPSSSSSSSSSCSTCHVCKETCKGLAVYCCESCKEVYHPVCLLRYSRNVKADGKGEITFIKDAMEHQEFLKVEFVGIDHLGLTG